MLIAKDLSGRLGYLPEPGEETKEWLRVSCECIVRIQADGDDLAKCCAILGRPLPTTVLCYTFLGDNAKEIAANWY